MINQQLKDRKRFIGILMLVPLSVAIILIFLGHYPLWADSNPKIGWPLIIIGIIGITLL